MFIMSKWNVILPSPDGSKNHTVRSGFIGDIPEWAAETAYFGELVKDGKIVIPASHKDKDTQVSAEKKVKVRRKAED